MRLLLDINILLDILLQRAGYPGSKQVLDLCETETHQGVVAWHTLPTVYYYYRKGHSEQQTWEMLRDLLQFLNVPTTGRTDVLNAWSYSIPDFEDALQAACAVAGNADAIITGNVRDFTSSPVKALTPEDFLTLPTV
ncbi:MAG: PIN domain-containing protein [Verrucomicrobiota bacterium]